MANKDTKESRKLHFRLAPFVASCILVLACIALAYVAGVMSGRASAVKDVALQQKQADSARMEEKKNSILTPEELEYARALRSDGARNSKVPSAPKALSPNTGNQPDANAGSPGNNTTASSVPAVQDAQQVKPQDPSQPVESALMYDYVFQVAALKNEDSVDALRQRLEGRGLRTRMQREGKMFYVLVLLRGNDARASEIAQTLEAMRLGKPVTRSRKAVMQP